MNTPALFLTVSTLVLLVSLLVTGRKRRLDTRLEELSDDPKGTEKGDALGQLAKAALPRMGSTLMPDDEAERTRLQTRLVHAGLYKPQAMHWYLGVKMLLMVGPIVVGLMAASLGLVPTVRAGAFSHSYFVGLVIGAVFGIFGMILPSYWLDQRKAKRQSDLRRALPDALDALVICLEGGLSLPDGVRRVSSELSTAHPLLAAELAIVQRAVQLGRSTGEALRDLGVRSDLEEIRTLASVLIQTERYGASLVNALRIHSETLRQKRMQYAEEMAQKAAVKILFPTLIFIFPGIFIVVLGPAVYHIIDILRSVRH
jgi:tight adherence protein C